MLAPVAIVQIRDLDFVAACMDELIVADVNAHVRNAGAVRAFEEHQIADFWRAYIIRARIVSGSACAWDLDACLVVYIIDIAAAVKTADS